jgi:hypothetical protein
VPAAGEEIVAGTAARLFDIGESGPEPLEGTIEALDEHDGALWALVDGASLRRSTDAGWEPVAELAGLRATCVLAGSDEVLVGSSEARLFRLEDGDLVAVEPFDRVEGREEWFTPWGDPPSTRSLSRDEAGGLYVNVHVGGIPRSDDAGASWTPTLEVRADAHQVVTPPSRPGLVLAATARGLALSEDRGGSWRFDTDGLPNAYCRAVAFAEETIFLTAADGPRGGHAALYRRPLTGGAFERCAGGLPEWFDRNINSHCLDALGDRVAFGTSAGAVYESSDRGVTWAVAAEGLPAVNCLRIRRG